MMFLLVRIIRTLRLGDVGVPEWMHVDKELDTNKKSQLLIYKELGRDSYVLRTVSTCLWLTRSMPLP